MIRTLTDAEEICLPSLRYGQLCVEPLKDILDWPIFGDRLALSQTSEQETDLLESDSDRSSLLRGVIKVSGMLTAKRRRLNADPEVWIDRLKAGAVGVSDREGKVFNEVDN